MNANDLVKFLFSPIVKILVLFSIFVLLAIFLLPKITNKEKVPKAIEKTELTKEEQKAIEITKNVKRADKNNPITEEKSSNKLTNTPASKKTNQPKEIKKSSTSPKNSNLKTLNTATTQNPPRRISNYSSRPILGPRYKRSNEIYLLSNQRSNQLNNEPKDFISNRYAPFGRLVHCKLVNTLESNVEGTPLIAIVIEDLWWTNSNGEKKLIIPAGTELHGKVSGFVRNRITSSGNFIFVWQLGSGKVGMELQVQGRVLEKSTQPNNPGKGAITDMAAGLPGRIMNNGQLNEMLQYTMAFVNGLSSGFQNNTTYSNGFNIIQEKNGSTKNAIASAFEQLSSVALENLSEKINKESYYIRVAAGTEFYLYIEQVTNIEKAAIADTMLNRLGSLRSSLNQKSNNPNATYEKLSQYHDSLTKALPLSLTRKLNIKGN
jgi:hypothetical protein